jgi:hypothetical protein
MIENGLMADWIATVTSEDIAMQYGYGGDVNRLYQLLVEGKHAKKNSLLLDDAVLKAAAERTDLFSPSNVRRSASALLS